MNIYRTGQEMLGTVRLRKGQENAPIYGKRVSIIRRSGDSGVWCAVVGEQGREGGFVVSDVEWDDPEAVDTWLSQAPLPAASRHDTRSRRRSDTESQKSIMSDPHDFDVELPCGALTEDDVLELLIQYDHGRDALMKTRDESRAWVLQEFRATYIEKTQDP